MSYSKQVFKILSSKLKANRRNLLINGMLIYALFFILIIMNPTLLKYIYEAYSIDAELIDRTVFIGIFVAFAINITFGSYKIIASFIRKKREYLLMPFDIVPKLHSIYFFTVIWIVINTAITFILSSMALIILEYKNGNLNLYRAYETYESVIEYKEEIIIKGTLSIIAVIAVISAIIIITFFKKEKRTIGNVFRVLAVIVLFSYSMDILVRGVLTFGYDEYVTLFIIDIITALILTIIAHIMAFKISVRE